MVSQRSIDKVPKIHLVESAIAVHGMSGSLRFSVAMVMTDVF